MKDYLNDARRAKNDEFYTKYEDVAKELIHWKHRLRGKNIICPADGPDSAFVKFLNDVKDEWEIKSITYSCWPVSMFDIDYSQYDICITNPPFSKYNKVLETLYNSNIDFIMLAPFLNKTGNKITRTKMQQHELFLGYGRHLPLSFTNTDKKVACDWITTFDDYNITRREYEAEDWTEYTMTALDYISTYDYDFLSRYNDYKLLNLSSKEAKKRRFRIFLKKRQ